MLKRVKWKVIPNTSGMYQISDLGQIRMIKKEYRIFNIKNISDSIYTHVEQAVKIKRYGNITLKIPYLVFESHLGRMSCPVSSIMYSSFYGIAGLSHEEIYHIDGNEMNNSKDNLIMCERDTKIDSIKKYYDTKDEKIRVPESLMYNFRFVSVYNMEGVKQNIYSSVNQASRALSIPMHIITSVADARKMLVYENKIFRRGNGPYIIDTALIRNEEIVVSNTSSQLNNRFILQYNSEGRLICVYNNFTEAAVRNNISPYLIKNAIANSQILEGCLWFIEGVFLQKSYSI